MTKLEELKAAVAAAAVAYAAAYAAAADADAAAYAAYAAYQDELKACIALNELAELDKEEITNA